ncbi:MAG TPA: hypothetical protein VKK79_00350 [Candidatus Lokiarchaeia archaeon]|nr:hypothetical protein [Candidatus Lokiarchaeia archaeon]
MESGINTPDESISLDEDAIFKSLTHQIRRQVIKRFSEGKSLSFSEIKRALDPIDSPTLAYHLKSLQALIVQVEGKYSLTDIGEAALKLLSKVDQSAQIKWYERKFWIAEIITVFCWIAVETLVPLAYYAPLGAWSFGLIMTVINITAVVNQVVIGKLRKR